MSTSAAASTMDTASLGMADRRIQTLFSKVSGTFEASAETRKAVHSAISANVSSKRDFEELFSSPESCSKFARAHKLNEESSGLLAAMQASKDIAPSMPVLDFILTVLFLAASGMCLYGIHNRGSAPAFCILLIAIDASVCRLKDFSSRVGAYLGGWVVRRGLVKSDPLAGPVQMQKWQEQAWQLFVHALFAAIETRIIIQEGWWSNPQKIWTPHPRDQWPLESALLQVFYLTQLGVWMYTCFIHRFVDSRRKDYFVMYTHHIVTIALVGVSWYGGYHRVGLLVLFVHDVSDVFVDLLKMVNYLKLEGKKGFFASEMAYVACVVSWMYWRLYAFPFRVLLTNGFHALYAMVPTNPATSLHLSVPEGLKPLVAGSDTVTISFPDGMRDYMAGWALCWVLIALHVYWFHLFLMIGYRILTESARSASRNEYEGESDDEEETEGEATPRPAIANGSGPAKATGEPVKPAAVATSAAATAK